MNCTEIFMPTVWARVCYIFLSQAAGVFFSPAWFLTRSVV